jgi:hypothetical protein
MKPTVGGSLESRAEKRPLSPDAEDVDGPVSKRQRVPWAFDEVPQGR